LPDLRSSKGPLFPAADKTPFMTFRTVTCSPLLHFFVLGACIFAFWAWGDDTAPAPNADRIVLEPDEARRLVDGFRQTWNRPPSREELQGMMQARALEEAYVREATALGLNRDDPVIRQRPSFKMKFLAEGRAAGDDPDDAALLAHPDANADRFRLPARVAFDQIRLAPQEMLRAAGILDALAGGANPAGFGGAGLLPPQFVLTPVPVIARTFGPEFVGALEALTEGVWSGPVRSGYGPHLVCVTA